MKFMKIWYENSFPTYFVFLYLIFSEVLSHGDDSYFDHSLCRKCGADISDFTQENFFNITSPASEAKETLKPTNLFLQTVTNPNGITFKVITLHKAGCVGVGEWYSEYSWFPNYSWKVCICPHCKAHIGWIFQSSESTLSHQTKPKSEGFFGLIWDNLIRETFSNSLLVGIPKSQKW